jgi:hypothetical protein
MLWLVPLIALLSPAPAAAGPLGWVGVRGSCDGAPCLRGMARVGGGHAWLEDGEQGPMAELQLGYLEAPGWNVFPRVMVGGSVVSTDDGARWQPNAQLGLLTSLVPVGFQGISLGWTGAYGKSHEPLQAIYAELDTPFLLPIFFGERRRWDMLCLVPRARASWGFGDEAERVGWTAGLGLEYSAFGRGQKPSDVVR